MLEVVVVVGLVALWLGGIVFLLVCLKEAKRHR